MPSKRRDLQRKWNVIQEKVKSYIEEVDMAAFPCALKIMQLHTDGTAPQPPVVMTTTNLEEDVKKNTEATFMAACNKGQGRMRPRYDNPLKPVWWPAEIEFRSPYHTPRFSIEDLKLILEKSRLCNREDVISQSSESDLGDRDNVQPSTPRDMSFQEYQADKRICKRRRTRLGAVSMLLQDHSLESLAQLGTRKRKRRACLDRGKE